MINGRMTITKNVQRFSRSICPTPTHPQRHGNIIDASDRKWAEIQILETMVSNIEVAMQNQAHSVPILQNVFPLEQIPHLADIDLKDKTLDDEE